MLTRRGFIGALAAAAAAVPVVGRMKRKPPPEIGLRKGRMVVVPGSGRMVSIVTTGSTDATATVRVYGIDADGRAVCADAPLNGEPVCWRPT